MMRRTLSLAAAAMIAVTVGVDGQGRREGAQKQRDGAQKQRDGAQGRRDAGVGCASEAAPAGSASASHRYFEMLIARPDCAAAYSLRDQARLDQIQTGAKARPDKKRPITYDAEMDAARITILATKSTDSQQKVLPLRVTGGSMLLTWDFRFDEHFQWRSNGDVSRHKTWRIEPGPWVAIKTEYRAGAKNGHLAQLHITVPGKKFLPEGAKRTGETMEPQRAQFFFDANTWVRVWILAEGLDQSTAQVSVWAADERRDPVRLYDRVALIPPSGGVAKFRIEYDTSVDQAKNTQEMHSWNRNIVTLRDVPHADLPSLLKRPESQNNAR